MLALAGAAGALSYWRGPRLVGEASTVYDQLSQQVLAFWHRFADAAWMKRVADHVRAYLSDNGGTLGGTAASLVTSTIGNLGSLLLIGVAAIYLAAAPRDLPRGLVGLLPKGWRPRGEAILAQEGRTLQRWFVGQLVDMVAIGAMTSLGLWLHGIPLVLTLGLIAALCNFVPYIGALAGSLPAIAIALGRSPELAVWGRGPVRRGAARRRQPDLAFDLASHRKTPAGAHLVLANRAGRAVRPARPDAGDAYHRRHPGARQDRMGRDLARRAGRGVINPLRA